MHRIPQFTAEENFNRIIMDKNTSYLLVEGPSDLPIYSEVVDLLIDKHQLKNKPITVFGGGKSSIINWLDRESPRNVAVILDMDFDDPDRELISDIVTPLRRYSIENYLFDKDVVVPLVSHLLSRNLEDVEQSLSIDVLREHWFDELSELLPVVFYYQKFFCGDKDKWSSVFINRGQGDWRLCSDKIDAFRLHLLNEMSVNHETCKESFNNIFVSGWCPIVNFPGKILLESFRRYLRELCNGVKKGSCSSITNTRAMVVNLASRLIRNNELELILLRAIA